MMYRIVYRIVALVPRYVSVAKKMYRCSPKNYIAYNANINHPLTTITSTLAAVLFVFPETEPSKDLTYLYEPECMLPHPLVASGHFVDLVKQQETQADNT